MEKLNALLQTETTEEAVKKQALLLASFIGTEEKHKWEEKAKELAMKSYCKRCQDMGGGYPCSHKCYEYLEYEKTLENQ